MTRKGCLYRKISSFGVTDFSYHDNIRVLAQDRSQRFREGHVDTWIDLGLTDTGQFVFDRVFNRDDPLFRRIDPAKKGVQRS